GGGGGESRVRRPLNATTASLAECGDFPLPPLLRSGPLPPSSFARRGRKRAVQARRRFVMTRAFAAFEWMIALRYLRARRQESFVSVISGFSLVGIALGVATLIIVMAVMNGFRHE